MEDKINSLLISEKDSVAVALDGLVENNTARYKTGKKIEQISILENVPIYHKFSICDIKEGDLVYKYGQVIGKASKNIKKGQHVHSQNLISIREFIED
ncbi:UxaA family hydrolase [Clostridium sp. JNZ X4-2]